MNIKQKLHKSVYVVAQYSEYMVIAMNNDYNESQVVGHLKGITGETLSVEYLGEFDERNDKWKVTV